VSYILVVSAGIAIGALIFRDVLKNITEAQGEIIFLALLLFNNMIASMSICVAFIALVAALSKKYL